MDPASAIGLASSILTFIDIGYKVVAGTLETAQTGQAPHTEHIDVVTHDLKNAVASFSKPVSSNASGHEKALGEASVKCQALSSELLALLARFKVPATKPGVSWDSVKVAIRRMRKDSKVQELQRTLSEFRSQILVHLVTILNDRQLATQIQLGNSVAEARTDLHAITEALENIRIDVADKLEAHLGVKLATGPISDDYNPPPDQKMLSDNPEIQHEIQLEEQVQELKDALDRLTDKNPEKTPETRILEHVYFGKSMFQREDTLKPADENTFRWFIKDISSEDDSDSGSMMPETINREERSQGLYSGKYNAQVASRFEEWMRSGNGVFHISGKAGSGKSTLMKLVLLTEYTHEMLREWAGEKRLLFARFYFWAGGDRLQSSLEGLHRSILFEVLMQRPELVKEVFREAYPVVACSRWDSPIYSRFFTTANFQKAFERLVCLPTDPRYRLCLFIDGLDEYSTDVNSGSLPETERENLARCLVNWATNDHVKILASSRLYSEFSETFAEDQRVHLHLLTHDDMINFGRRLFETHRVFQFPGVKERYKSLVAKVVGASDGVFLWTGLAIQRMLASLARRDSFKSLEKQLETAPRDLNVLYEKMFLAIDDHERHEAMKLMLLVSEERKSLGELSHPRGVNAMAITWLESLENPEFPANQPFSQYTEKEIQENRQLVHSRVSGYTQGLLEVVTHKLAHNPYHSSMYLQHTVRFFHKSAMEYVAASRLAEEVRSSSPQLFNLEFYTRLSLAELHFGSRHDWDFLGQSFRRYPLILRKYLSTSQPCRSLIEAYRAAFEHLRHLIGWGEVWIELNNPNPVKQISPAEEVRSFDHWMANEVQEPYAAQYLTERTQILPDLPHPPPDLSLLLSVACRQRGEDPSFRRLDRVKMVLALGSDLHDSIYLRIGSLTKEARTLVPLSVWQAWCLFYVTAQLNAWKLEAWHSQAILNNDLDTSQILELFLEKGVDSDCYMLLADIEFSRPDPSNQESDSEVSTDSASESDPESEELDRQDPRKRRRTDQWNPASRWSSASLRRRFKTDYVVSLRDLVRQAKPDNHDQLERLLGTNRSTPEFPPTNLSEIEAELATREHPHFESPRVLPVDLKQFFADKIFPDLLVYWIRWKDTTIPGYLTLRLY